MYKTHLLFISIVVSTLSFAQIKKRNPIRFAFDLGADISIGKNEVSYKQAVLNQNL